MVDEIFKEFRKSFVKDFPDFFKAPPNNDKNTVPITGKTVTLEIAVPGMTAKDLNIDFDGVSIRVDTKTVKSGLFSSKEFVLSGCSNPSFKATVSNGLLVITISQQPFESVKIIATDIK